MQLRSFEVGEHTTVVSEKGINRMASLPRTDIKHIAVKLYGSRRNGNGGQK